MLRKTVSNSHITVKNLPSWRKACVQKIEGFKNVKFKEMIDWKIIEPAQTERAALIFSGLKYNGRIWFCVE